MSRTIALLTDFGTTDTYVGVMKGVMLGICPDVQFVDLTHAIQPQNIKQAAFALLNSYRYFPAGTIFLVVVDPGVGSERRAVAARAGGYTFIAPDNGVLGYTLHEIDSPRQQVIELTNRDYRLSRTSNTFHGRDIFAPAAAHLAAGAAFEALGETVGGIEMLSAPTMDIGPGRLAGEVLHIDHFGSAVTSIGLLTWDALGQLILKPRLGDAESLVFSVLGIEIRIDGISLRTIHRTYAEVGQGEALALVGSSGYLELAINGGSFVEHFGVKIGDPVELVWDKQTG